MAWEALEFLASTHLLKTPTSVDVFVFWSTWLAAVINFDWAKCLANCLRLESGFFEILSKCFEILG